MFSDLWVPDISILEKIIRPVLVYFFLLVALRIGGKRELGKFTGFDLIVLLMLSNAVQDAIIGNDDSVLGGFIGAATILFTNFLVVRFVYHHPRVQRIIEGKPTILLINGHLIHENLEKELINEAELRSVLRQQGFENLSELKVAMLETSGSLTIERATNLPTGIEAELIQRLERIEQQLTTRT